MKADQTVLARPSTILFFVTGVFWAGIIAVGGGALLAWAVLTCFASGAFLVVWESSWVTRPLVAASALFGIVLTAYQLYEALATLTTGLRSVAYVSAPLFAAFLVVYLYIFYACSWRRSEK